MAYDRCFLLGQTEMNTEMNVWNAFSPKNEERKGAWRKSVHLSSGGNYSMTPSPVTRGLGERGLLQLEAGRDGERRKVGGCCYPKSNWPETSCAVPANFHNDRISPFPLSHTHTQRESHTQALSPSRWWWLLYFVSYFVLIPFSFTQRKTIWPFAQLEDGNRSPVVHQQLQNRS